MGGDGYRAWAQPAEGAQRREFFHDVSGGAMVSIAQRITRSPISKRGFVAVCLLVAGSWRLMALESPSSAGSAQAADSDFVTQALGDLDDPEATVKMVEQGFDPALLDHL